MKLANCEIRGAIKEKNLKHYQVAKYVGVTPCTFSRWLSKEIEPAQRQELLQIIKSIK